MRIRKPFIPEGCLFCSVNFSGASKCYVVIRHKINGEIVSILLDSGLRALYFHNIDDYKLKDLGGGIKKKCNVAIVEQDPNSSRTLIDILSWLKDRSLEPKTFDSCDDAEIFLIKNLGVRTDSQLLHIHLTEVRNRRY
jgi:hypothetical protein